MELLNTTGSSFVAESGYISRNFLLLPSTNKFITNKLSILNLIHIIERL